MTRCKFVCLNKTVNPGGNGELLSFSPAYSGSEENKAFFSSTSGGSIQFYCTNPAATAAFEIGKEYFVDFTPAWLPKVGDCATPTLAPTPPPVDNDHVAEGCEKFSAPTPAA